MKVLNVLQFNYYSFRKHGRGISRIFNLLPWYEESGEFSLAAFKHFLFRILLSLVEQKMIESVAKYLICLLFSTIDSVDLWVAGLAEEHVQGGQVSTYTCILYSPTPQKDVFYFKFYFVIVLRFFIVLKFLI